jgi:hypothetical protein
MAAGRRLMPWASVDAASGVSSSAGRGKTSAGRL